MQLQIYFLETKSVQIFLKLQEFEQCQEIKKLYRLLQIKVQCLSTKIFLKPNLLLKITFSQFNQIFSHISYFFKCEFHTKVNEARKQSYQNLYSILVVIEIGVLSNTLMYTMYKVEMLLNQTSTHIFCISTHQYCRSQRTV